MKTIIVSLLMFLAVGSGGNVVVHQEIKENFTEREMEWYYTLSEADQKLLNYSVSNSMSKAFLSKGKKVEMDGEFSLTEFNSVDSYLDLGLRIKEEKTQYFKISGSNEYFSLKSMSRLRNEFMNLQNLK